MTANAPMLQLIASLPGGEKRFRLRPGKHVIGASSACDLQLDDPTVSRRHLRLTFDADGTVGCEDLSSSNGTWRNGARVASARLDGDSLALRLGEVPIRIERLPADESRLAVAGDDQPSVVPAANPSLATWGEGAAARFALRQLPRLLELLAASTPVHTFASHLLGALLVITPELAYVIRRGSALVATGGDNCDGTGRDWTQGDWSLLVTGAGESIDRHEPLLRLALQLLIIADRDGANGPRSVPTESSTPAVSLDPPTQCHRLQKLYEQAMRIAPSEIGVLVHGETGTGKELFARFLHANTGRSAARLVALNCAALPADLLEAELFGIERGVATGVSERAGRFEEADGGTLFLDEIGDMALETQAKILRVLQERQVYRVGGRQPRPARVRVISATNRDLETMVSEGSFRRDLYHRLADWVVALPALRERREDIANLAAHFLASELRRLGKRFGGVSEAALGVLRAYRWPGNVRELEREMLRCALFLESGEPLQSGHLQDRFRQSDRDTDGTLRAQLDRAERVAIRDALTAADGDVAAAAVRLGVGKSTLYRRIDQLDID